MQPEKTLKLKVDVEEIGVQQVVSLEVNLEERLLGSVLVMILVVDVVIVVEILTRLLKLKPKTTTPTPLTKHTHPFSKSESNPNPNPLFSPITYQVAEQSATPVLSTIDRQIPDIMGVLLFHHRRVV